MRRCKTRVWSKHSRPIRTSAWILGAFAFLTRCQNGACSDRPLIGILTQPGHPAPDGFSYIAASYVKQVQASGARAVPIECDLSRKDLKKKFEAVNGIVIPGGGQNLSPGHEYFDSAQYLVNLSIEAYENGDYIPVHGVCLGLEVLSIILSKPFNTSILGRFDAENYPSPIVLTGEATHSRMFANMSAALLASIQQAPILMQNHVNGLEYGDYLSNSGLRELFTVTSLSTDRNGKIYVSTMESKQYPITATQFHPEKNAFEWTHSLDIPHNPDAIEVTHAFGNFIVREARRNQHKPESEEQETRLLIQNYPLIFTASIRSHGVESAFDECYFFPMLSEKSQSRVEKTQVLAT